MGTLSSAEAASRPDRARLGVLAFACSLSLITYLDRVCIGQVSEFMRKELLFDTTVLGRLFSAEMQMGFVFSAFMAGYALFEIPAGLLGDRWGARRVLIIIVIGWSLFTALTGMVYPAIGWPLLAFVLLMLIRFCFGSAEAGAYPNLTRLVRGWFPPRERAFAQGAIWACARLGGFIAPGAITGLAWLLDSWRAAFWTLGFLGMVWAAFYFLWSREPTAQPDRRDDVAGPPTALPTAKTHDWPSWRVLIGSGTIWAICLVSFCVSLGWYFFPTWQPEYFAEVYGIKYKDSGLLVGLPFLFGAAGSFLGGVLSSLLILRTGNRRWGRSAVGVFGFGMAGVCMLAASFTSVWWHAVLMFCLACFFNDLAIPVIWAVCADVGGRFVGSVAGLMNMIGAVGGMLSPILIPWVREQLWPGPGSSAGMAAGVFILPAKPETFGLSDRWQFVITFLAATWFIGSAAWVFVNAAKPIFGEHQAKPQAANSAQ